MLVIIARLEHSAAVWVVGLKRVAVWPGWIQVKGVYSVSLLKAGPAKKEAVRNLVT